VQPLGRKEEMEKVHNLSTI